MKRLISVFLILCILSSFMGVFGAGTEIIIDGKRAAIAQGMGSVRDKDNRTFVPVRFLLEYFGFEVGWENADQSVFGRHPDGRSFVMQVGNNRLFFFEENGNPKSLAPMDTAPFLDTKENRTYVPIRFIAEAIGYDVGWDDATKTAILKKK